MFSLPKIMHRMGISGRQLAFFKAVCVYFAVSAGAGGPSLAGAGFKCAPVLFLCAVLLNQCKHVAHDPPRLRYCQRVAAGLALSALGDALLVWPQHFVAGMGAFAAAHAAYIAAFGWRPLRPGLALPLGAGLAGYLALVRAGGALRLLVPLYSLLLTTMAWRGLARALRPTSPAALGVALFLVSDALLGYSMFAHPLPYRQIMVMSTYYLAQLCIATSALEPPAPGPQGEGAARGGGGTAPPALSVM